MFEKHCLLLCYTRAFEIGYGIVWLWGISFYEGFPTVTQKRLHDHDMIVVI